MRYVEWCEPWDGDDFTPNLVCRLSVEDAILVQKRSAKSKGHEYETDEQALDDFKAIYWATEVEI